MSKATWKAGWKESIVKGLVRGIAAIGTDIHKQAVVNAPKRSRALANSGRIALNGTSVTVSFGGSAVPYARIRHEVNKLHPATVHYLSNAANTVARTDMSRYFKGVV